MTPKPVDLTLTDFWTLFNRTTENSRNFQRMSPQCDSKLSTLWLVVVVVFCCISLSVVFSDGLPSFNEDRCPVLRMTGRQGVSNVTELWARNRKSVKRTVTSENIDLISHPLSVFKFRVRSLRWFHLLQISKSIPVHLKCNRWHIIILFEVNKWHFIILLILLTRERVHHGHVQEARWDTVVYGTCACPCKKIFSCVWTQETQRNHRTESLLWVCMHAQRDCSLSTPKNKTSLGVRETAVSVRLASTRWCINTFWC